MYGHKWLETSGLAKIFVQRVENLNHNLNYETIVSYSDGIYILDI